MTLTFFVGFFFDGVVRWTNFMGHAISECPVNIAALSKHLYIGERVVSGRVPEIWFSGTWDQLKNGFKASWTRLFFIFYIIWLFFQSSSEPYMHSTLKNHQIWQKNEENKSSTCLQPISLSYCGYLKPVFRVPFPPLWKRAAAILLLSWKYLLFSLISLRV